MESNKNAYYLKNKSKRLEYQKQYNKENKTKSPEKIRKYNATYYRDNKSKMLMRSKINQLSESINHLNDEIDKINNNLNYDHLRNLNTMIQSINKRLNNVESYKYDSIYGTKKIKKLKAIELLPDCKIYFD